MAKQAYGIEIGGEIYDFVSSGVTSGEVEDMLSSYTYSKQEIDDKDAEKLSLSAFSAYSGTVASELSEMALESDLNALEGTFSAFSATIINEIQEIESSGVTSGTVQSMIDDSISGKLDVNVFNVYSGVVASEMVNKAENSDLEALEGTFSAFSATVAAEIQELEASGMTSGAVQDMLTAYTYDKTEIDNKDAQKLDITAFETFSGEVSSELSEKATESDLNALKGTVSAHTANTDIHVTAADKTAWSNKQDALTAGDNIIISGNVISTTVQYWCGDESQWASISGSTDPNTIYMVHE